MNATLVFRTFLISLYEHFIGGSHFLRKLSWFVGWWGLQEVNTAAGVAMTPTAVTPAAVTLAAVAPAAVSRQPKSSRNHKENAFAFVLVFSGAFVDLWVHFCLLAMRELWGSYEETMRKLWGNYEEAMRKLWGTMRKLWGNYYNNDDNIDGNDHKISILVNVLLYYCREWRTTETKCRKRCNIVWESHDEKQPIPENEIRTMRKLL